MEEVDENNIDVKLLTELVQNAQVEHITAPKEKKRV